MATTLQRIGQPSFSSQSPSCSSSSQELGAAHLSSSCYHSQGLRRSLSRAADSFRADKSLRARGISRQAVACEASLDGLDEVTLLDYGAGNVRSVRNAIKLLGYKVRDVEKPSDILDARKLIFPGVGAYASAMEVLRRKDLIAPVKEYVQSGRSFLGICLGLQLLFDGSEENDGVEGLGIIPGTVAKFDTALGLPVPHIGWNGLSQKQESAILAGVNGRHAYFVHSYRAVETPENRDWVLATSEYGGEFVSAVKKGEVEAVQFHPEKSGAVGLDILRRYLGPNRSAAAEDVERQAEAAKTALRKPAHALAKRVIACLDVRANDNGDLVVTKGDSYDVREKTDSREVRNLGKPVELAGRYFKEGADEVTFLNITGFRDFPLADMPMLEVLQRTSENVFVPLTVGGGIRDFTDSNGKHYSSLEVAAEYFRSGADKISIGSDAVTAAEEYLKTGKKTGKTAIEQISYVYGAQAVVVSIDPRRVYVRDPNEVPYKTTKLRKLGPNGEEYAWYQCTVKGGREGRPIGAYELAQAVEALGAGEILLNCIDEDGQGAGFDTDLVKLVSDAVSIPVIASSGAGCPEHFSEVFHKTRAAAALAAGIFHREEVPIRAVKEHLAEAQVETRLL
ncbi:glutamine amidotransferase and cyclase [Klebsormidium nitens]|uniref:Imidazole glycerol phosphate synthase hisHF n=1 Tax=Klebsormidium nitens TaxID=105231 RepID=A0A1Y1HMV7_KLENI|nr:glutamine amidotransferase and cyclase [Klebsormidium nitens]|eukprot:GAQ79954.1 glutamine amidotransferase and cyclase [Klebsormidium nitens]